MSRLRLAVAALLTLVACKHPGRVEVGPVTDATPTTHPSAPPVAKVQTMSIESPSSYVTPWVDGTRASHASAPLRALGSFARVVDLAALKGPLAARPLGRVEHLLAAPDGEHLVLRGADAAWVFDRSGQQVGSVPRSTSAGLTFAVRTGIFHALDAYDWMGAEGALKLYVPGGVAGRVWATHVTGDAVFFVNQEPLLGNHDRRQPERLDVIGNHLVAGPPAKKLLGADALEATRGMGAIARDGRIVVVSVTGELRVYAPQADESWNLKREVTRRVGLEPYDVSIVGDTIALLVAHVAPGSEGAEGMGPYQIGTDVFLRFPEMHARWTTTLHLLSMDGAPRGQVTVPFEVLEPPIDGGGGRIYLAGTGLAAVQDLRVAWSQPRGARTLGAAFAGGELAVAVDGALRLVDRDGTVRQSFATANETLVTPPAIAPDGAVWIATERAIYAAR